MNKPMQRVLITIMLLCYFSPALCKSKLTITPFSKNINDSVFLNSIKYFSLDAKGYYTPVKREPKYYAPDSLKIFDAVSPNKQHSMEFYKAPGKHNYRLNLDGKIYYTPYTQVFKPIIDNKGNFAYCGIRDYYMYRNINGIEKRKPLSKYGFRAEVLSISVKGNVVHSYNADDSLYLYYDNELLDKRMILHDYWMKINPYNYLHYETIKGSDLLGCSGTIPDNLYAVIAADRVYVVFNGILSDAIYPSFNDKVIEDPVTGETITIKGQGEVRPAIKGGADKSIFFFIQELAHGRYGVFINNKMRVVLTSANIDDLGSVVSQEYYLDKKQLIFYGLKQGKIYRYKVKI